MAVNITEADLLWLAAVKDETGQFFLTFDRNVDNLTRRTNDAFNNVQAGGKESAAAIGLIGGVIAGITQNLVSMGLQAVRQFAAVINSAKMLAARADTLAVSLKVVGNNAGYSDAELARFEERMKDNGITTIKTREALLKMSQAQLDLSKSAELARIAQDAAVIAGTNSSEAFGRMIHGITTLNPLILRHMGILVNAQAAYKEYAAEADTTTQALDQNTKVNIFLNQVLEAGTRIAGTYEAAMGTAGKQAGSLARYQEELMLAIGRTMQPAYLNWIQFMTRELKDARKWFEENEEAVRKFGEALGVAVSEALDMVGKLLDLVSQLPKAIYTAAEALASLDEEVAEADTETNMQRLKTAAAQFATLWVRWFTIQATYIGEAVKLLGQWVASVVAAVKIVATAIGGGDVEAAVAKWGSTLQAMSDTFVGAADKAKQAGDDATLSVAKWFGLIEEEAPDAADALDEVGDNMEAIAAETEDVIESVKELNEKFKKELAELAKQAMREAIDDEIREARRREDILRRHNDNIKKIYRDAAKERAKVTEDLADEERKLIDDQADERQEAAEDLSEDLLDIETDYQRRLRDIRSRFDEEAGELARKNDAVGLARLIRQTNRQVAEAKQGREDRIADAKTDYERELADLQDAQAKEREAISKDAEERRQELEDRLQERLDAEKESYAESLTELELSLERDRQDKARHRAWEEEDRREKYAAEMKALGEHFASLQFINESGLRSILAQHAEYIKDDLDLWNAYYAERQSVASRAAATEINKREMARQPGAWGGYESPEEYYSEKEASGGGWGFARGGVGIAMSPQRVTIAENEPELIAAVPLSATVQHNVHVDDMSLRIQGVSPQMEQDLAPTVKAMLIQLGSALRSSIQAGGV